MKPEPWSKEGQIILLIFIHSGPFSLAAFADVGMFPSYKKSSHLSLVA